MSSLSPWLQCCLLVVLVATLQRWRVHGWLLMGLWMSLEKVSVPLFPLLPTRASRETGVACLSCQRRESIRPEFFRWPSTLLLSAVAAPIVHWYPSLDDPLKRVSADPIPRVGVSAPPTQCSIDVAAACCASALRE